MALPEQIRLQSEAIQKLYTDTNGEGDPPATPPVPPVAPLANSATAPVPPVPAEPPIAGDPPAENFEQKYRSLQGMFNAEVPKLNATIKELSDKNDQMTSLMASLHTVSSTAAPAAPVHVTDADKAEYGDSIEMMRKVSSEVVHPLHVKIAALETAINNLATSMNTSVLPQVRHVAQQQFASAEDRFWSELQREVPDWTKINNDSDFKSWLLSIDDLTGQTRQSYLEQAQNQLDVTRVIAFFRAYAQHTGKTLPLPTAQTRAASELELQIAPGRSRASTPPVNPNAKTYTHADIAKFYSDVRKGLYKGREAERNKIELDLLAAPQEGRIVANA